MIDQLIVSGLYRITAKLANTVFSLRDEIDTSGSLGGTRTRALSSSQIDRIAW